MEKKRILGLDYGKKRIGIAVTDPLRIFAYPLETLSNDSNFWSNFDKIINQFDIEKIVVGYPVKEDGSKTDVTGAVEKFAGELNKKYKYEIVYVDERYSSAIAKERVISSVVSKKKRRNKGLLDKNAAAVILEDYLKTTN
ncbi:MAG: Holliday junction resolvase RuvX [Melioribacteraceae bacterium]|nr:Holliday junction resolvase RuvX [Melioribacteraceae bacterium]